MTFTPAKTPRRTEATVAGARFLVVVLAFAWGLNWLATAIALPEVSPWSLRFAGAAIGTVTLFSAALIAGYDMSVPRKEWIHIFIAGFFNVAAFHILGAFAQLSGATSRVVVVTYSMPIWSALMARFALGEKMNPMRYLALALCITGLTILVWPLFAHGAPVSLLYALGCALCWAFATVYVKWMKLTVAPLANAAWQLFSGFVILEVGMLAFDGYPKLWPMSAAAFFSLLFIGFIGVGLAHFLWWSIVGKLPTITASIGSLLVPVVGVVSSVIVLGERPTWTDVIGFLSIFAAAACVLLQPGVKHDEMPE